ncbi:hypothetical protein BKA63DRAFT_570697 [Paraphoma chrysanthemicola]|nr:hypothetical protein BKA63DRAFT_570697 [Paraphoma chrysanthemicola]
MRNNQVCNPMGKTQRVTRAAAAKTAQAISVATEASSNTNNIGASTRSLRLKDAPGLLSETLPVGARNTELAPKLRKTAQQWLSLKELDPTLGDLESLLNDLESDPEPVTVDCSTVLLRPTDNRHQFDLDDATWTKYLYGGIWSVVLKRRGDELLGKDSWAKELDQAGCGDSASLSSPDLWNALKPALQLASNLLLSPASSKFFRRLKYGVEKFDPESSRIYLDYIEDDSKIEQFFRGDCSRLPSDTSSSRYIIVNQAYKDFAASGVHSPCAIARFALSLGHSLHHEIAHAYYVRDRDEKFGNYSEPFWNLQQYNKDSPNGEDGELGYALEHVVFNAQICSVIHPEEGVDMEWDHLLVAMHGTNVVSLPSLLTYPLDPKWIHKLLTQKFWDDVAKLTEKEAEAALFMPEAQWAGLHQVEG